METNDMVNNSRSVSYRQRQRLLTGTPEFIQWLSDLDYELAGYKRPRRGLQHYEVRAHAGDLVGWVAVNDPEVDRKYKNLRARARRLDAMDVADAAIERRER